MRVANQEQPFHPIYNYALITDAEEGLILVDVNTLQDGALFNAEMKQIAPNLGLHLAFSTAKAARSMKSDSRAQDRTTPPSATH